MIIDITEEEREFLERVCTRAKIFCMINSMKKPNSVYSDFEKDLSSIETLITKFTKIGDNLMKKDIKDDHRLHK